jgi:TolB-like protein
MKKTIIYLVIMCFVSIYHNAVAQKDKEAIRAYRDAEKAYKRKNLSETLRFLSEALSGTVKKKQMEEALELLPKAYNEFFDRNIASTDSLEKKTSAYKDLSSILDKKQLIDTYTLMDARQKEIKNIPADILSTCKLTDKAAQDYAPKKAKAQEQYDSFVVIYCGEQYKLGEEKLAKNNKVAGRLAYLHFDKVRQYNAGYRDVESKLAEAKRMATYKIAIASIENLSGMTNYGYLGSMIVSEVASRIQGANKSGEELYFLELIPVDATSGRSLLAALTNESKLQATAKEMGAELVIFGSYRRVSHSLSEVKTSADKKSRNVVVGKRNVTTKDGKTKQENVYDNVYATYYTHTQEQHAVLDGNVYIYNMPLKKYMAQNYDTDGSGYNGMTWYSYDGHKGALYDNDYNATQNPRPKPRPEREIIDQTPSGFASDIISTLSRTLKELYTNQ